MKILDFKGILTFLIGAAVVSWLGAFIDVQKLKAADVEKKEDIREIKAALKPLPEIKADVKLIKRALNIE